MKVLTKLTLSSMKQNKRRTLVTIIAITLCTVLMTTVGIVFSTSRATGEASMKESTLKEHIIIDNVNMSDLDKIKKDDIDTIYPVSKSEERVNVTIGSEILSTYNVDFYALPEEKLESYKLFSGTYPTNSSEILVSKSMGLQLNKEMIIDDNTYKIVGYYETKYGYDSKILTLYDNQDNISFYINFKEVKDVRSKSLDIVKSIDKDINDVKFNDSVLQFYNESQDTSSNTGILLLLVAIIVLCTVIGIFTLLVVYNSYAVSVIERKKMFGELSSIGATRKQIIKSMLIESFIELFISVILGFIISYSLVYIVINFINTNFNCYYFISIYSNYLLISYLMLIIFVLLSSLMPAVEASFITPIEALKENADIKNKKIKGSKLVSKLFGIEGELAYKNIKRNKRKYEVTTFSLILSFTIFVTFSFFINLYTSLNSYNTNVRINYDYEIILSDAKIDTFLDEIEKYKYIEDINVMQTSYQNIKAIDLNLYNEDYLKLIGSNLNALNKYYEQFNLVRSDSIVFVGLYDKYYNKYKLPSEYTIFNKVYQELSNESGDITNIYDGYYFKENDLSLELCNYYQNLGTKISYFDNCSSIKNISLIDENILGIDYANPYGNNGAIYLITNQNNYKNLLKTNQKSDLSYHIFIKTNDIKKLENDLITLKDDYNFSIKNNIESVLSNTKIVSILTIVAYSFLIFISLISIINIYNSISTTIKLRRKEFAMLRSIGMNEKSFNKMIRLESIFFALKALIWGVILSTGIILWIKNFYKEIYKIQSSLGNKIDLKIPLPITYILIASIVLVLITYIIMTLTSKKTKKDNIADILKQDN